MVPAYLSICIGVKLARMTQYPGDLKPKQRRTAGPQKKLNTAQQVACHFQTIFEGIFLPDIVIKIK